MVIGRHRINFLAKGNILIEALIAVAVVGTITASLLNYNNFSKNIFSESKETAIAINALDSVMTYFETHAAPVASGGQWADQAVYTEFARTGSTANLNNLTEGARLVAVLNQLQNWRIEYMVTTHNGVVYRDRQFNLRISWDRLRQGAAPVRVTKEIFSIFTSRLW